MLYTLSTLPTNLVERVLATHSADVLVVMGAQLSAKQRHVTQEGVEMGGVMGIDKGKIKGGSDQTIPTQLHSFILPPSMGFSFIGVRG